MIEVHFPLILIMMKARAVEEGTAYSYLLHRGCTDSRISKKNQDGLTSRLARMDQQNGFTFKLEHGWQRIPDTYERMKLVELKQFCKQRKCPVGTPSRN